MTGNNIIDNLVTRSLVTHTLPGVGWFIIESFRFDYDYEIRHFWRQLLASSRADVTKS